MVSPISSFISVDIGHFGHEAALIPVRICELLTIQPHMAPVGYFAGVAWTCITTTPGGPAAPTRIRPC